MLRHFIPLMIERKQGVIVNMSSGWGRSAAAEVKQLMNVEICVFVYLYLNYISSVLLH